MTRDLDLTPINGIMDSTIFHLLCSFTLTCSHSHLIPLRIVSLHVSCKQQCLGKMPSTNWRVPYPSWRFGKPLQSEPSEPSLLSSDHSLIVISDRPVVSSTLKQAHTLPKKTQRNHDDFKPRNPFSQVIYHEVTNPHGPLAQIAFTIHWSVLSQSLLT